MTQDDGSPVDNDPAATPVDAEVEQPESEPVADAEPVDPFAELQKEVAILEDKLLRARADYDNLQKRVAREAAIEKDRAKARAVDPFLQVFEFAQMAAKEAEKTPGALAEGVKMLVREFERALDDHGVKSFGKVGDQFDTGLYEATGEIEVDGVEAGAVSTVVRPGYKLGDRVLRYAKVTTQPADSK